MVSKSIELPKGIGLGLRFNRLPLISMQKPAVAWLEIRADDILFDTTLDLTPLLKLRADYPIALECRGMSLGSVDPLNKHYFQRLNDLIKLIEPFAISDYAAWASYNGQYFHELLPLPYNEESIALLAANLNIAQDWLGRSILVENIVNQLTFTNSPLNEGEFLQALAAKSGCLLKLNLHALTLNAESQRQAASDYCQKIVGAAIAQFHLGRDLKLAELQQYASRAIAEEVWQCYRHALSTYGQRPTLIEWGTQIPALNDLQQDAEKAQQLTDGFVYAS